MNKELSRYVENGQMSVRNTVVNGSKYSIYCYTKDQFFNHEWDLMTINHRGKIYTDDGIVINNPFPKIFNLNETQFTSLDVVNAAIQNEYFEVLDKVNGHLTIVSPDIVRGNLLVSTKGSFEGDLANADRELVSSLGIDKVIMDNMLDYTFMFECLADYDQHLWYKEQIERYNVKGNTLILLGAISNTTQQSLYHEDLEHFAKMMNVPVTIRHRDLEQKNIDINKLFDDRGIEGYVLHFPEINFRFKVKTKEYVSLHYMKDITAEKLATKLASSIIENLYADHDEELYPVIDALKVDFCEFVNSEIDQSRVEDIRAAQRPKAEIANNVNLNMYERWVLLYPDRDILDLLKSKHARIGFRDSGLFKHTEQAIKDFFSKGLYTNVVCV